MKRNTKESSPSHSPTTQSAWENIMLPIIQKFRTKKIVHRYTKSLKTQPNPNPSASEPQVSRVEQQDPKPNPISLSKDPIKSPKIASAKLIKIKKNQSQPSFFHCFPKPQSPSSREKFRERLTFSRIEQSSAPFTPMARNNKGISFNKTQFQATSPSAFNSQNFSFGSLVSLAPNPNPSKPLHDSSKFSRDTSRDYLTRRKLLENFDRRNCSGMDSQGTFKGGSHESHDQNASFKSMESDEENLLEPFSEQNYGEIKPSYCPKTIRGKKLGFVYFRLKCFELGSPVSLQFQMVSKQFKMTQFFLYVSQSSKNPNETECDAVFKNKSLVIYHEKTNRCSFKSEKLFFSLFCEDHLEMKLDFSFPIHKEFVERNMKEAAQKKKTGFEAISEKIMAGHSETGWRDQIAQALKNKKEKEKLQMNSGFLRNNKNEENLKKTLKENIKRKAESLLVLSPFISDLLQFNSGQKRKEEKIKEAKAKKQHFIEEKKERTIFNLEKSIVSRTLQSFAEKTTKKTKEFRKLQKDWVVLMSLLKRVRSVLTPYKVCKQKIQQQNTWVASLNLICVGYKTAVRKKAWTYSARLMIDAQWY